jgi:hypothetical protein
MEQRISVDHAVHISSDDCELELSVLFHLSLECWQIATRLALLYYTKHNSI